MSAKLLRMKRTVAKAGLDVAEAEADLNALLRARLGFARADLAVAEAEGDSKALLRARLAFAEADHAVAEAEENVTGGADGDGTKAPTTEERGNTVPMVIDEAVAAAPAPAHNEGGGAAAIVDDEPLTAPQELVEASARPGAVCEAVPGGCDGARAASPAAEADVELELGILTQKGNAVAEPAAANGALLHTASELEMWEALADKPYSRINDGRPSQSETIRTDAGDVDTSRLDNDASSVQQEVGQASEDDVINITEDETDALHTVRRVRNAAKVSREGARRALEHDAQVEKEEPRKGKRKALEEETYDDENDEEQDELKEETEGQDDLVPNGGLAPKGGLYEYAEQVMRFGAFAWAFSSVYGEDVQELVWSMVKPLIRLDMRTAFETGKDLPGLPACALSWMATRRTACKIMTPAYVRDKLHEPHLEHRMLYCYNMVRQLKFEDVAEMYGRRGCILLVHGLLQARASNLLGDDWALCVAEVARLLEALARTAEGDHPCNKSGDEVRIDEKSTVLEVLGTLDEEATDAVTLVLLRRVRELKIMEDNEETEATEGSAANPAKRFKKSRTPSPAKSSHKTSPAKASKPEVSAGSPAAKKAHKAEGEFEKGSSNGSPAKKARR